MIHIIFYIFSQREGRTRAVRTPPLLPVLCFLILLENFVVQLKWCSHQSSCDLNTNIYISVNSTVFLKFQKKVYNKNQEKISRISLKLKDKLYCHLVKKTKEVKYYIYPKENLTSTHARHSHFLLKRFKRNAMVQCLNSMSSHT